MNLRLIQALLMCCTLMVGMMAQAKPAAAQSAQVEVRVIAASRTGEGVDAQLQDLKPQLERGFTSYTGFKQIGSQTMTLPERGTSTMRLPDGSALTLTFHGYVGSLAKLGLNLAERLNTTLRVSPGSTFFQAGLSYQEGILVLAIKIKP